MRVLVADDDMTYRMLLERLLNGWGYDISICEDGEQAWDLLNSTSEFQVCLFDWIMPGVTGLELCRRLRDERPKDPIYTILLTGRAEKQDILKGLENGAHDYLVKPFNPGELRCRLDIGARLMKTDAILKKTNDELALYAQEMELLAQTRAEQLVHADRMATLGVMAAGVAHEINNPTSFISGNLQIFNEFMPTVTKALTMMSQGEGKEAAQALFVLEELPEMIKSMGSGVERIAKIVRGLRQYSHSGGSLDGIVDVNEAIKLSAQLANASMKHHVLSQFSLSPEIPPVRGDQQQLEQVLVNIFVNAADALREVGGGALDVKTFVKDQFVVVIIEDTGPGFPENKLADIWKPFFTTKEVGKGTGLGLSICQRIIKEHGGSITAENRKEGGARFTIELPVLVDKEN